MRPSNLAIISSLITGALYAATALAASWPLDSAGNPASNSITTFYINPMFLWDNRDFINRGRRELNPAMQRLLRYANAAAADTNVYSVTAKVNSLYAPSGDPHDYYSLARYYWPSTAGGQYVRKDGYPNPEIYSIPDSAFLDTMMEDVFDCGLAYFFTGNSTYSDRAAQRLRDWFINPATKMNPNLNFANWIKGTPANANGTTAALEFSRVWRVTDGIGLIRNSPSFTNDDWNALQAWFNDYYNWLIESPRGQAEGNSPNNQGTWYDVQRTTILLFLGQTALAADVQRKVTLSRLLQQVLPDGQQPLELTRPLSWQYSIFNLKAHFTQGWLAQSTGVEYFQFQTNDGRSAAKALNYLMSYTLVNGSGWPVTNIGNFDPTDVVELAKEAFIVYRDVKYTSFVDAVQGKPASWNPFRLWAPYASIDGALRAGAPRMVGKSSVFRLLIICVVLVDFLW
ncbi:alginate lyase-domain-containing protein [Cladochytrium replicatum]|nr:alginate lyase-domain-containing protein [Cladochytrium replicatum]